MKQPRLFAVVIMSLTFCSVFVACSKPAPSSPPTIRVGHAPHDHHAALYIAALNPQYFKENGGIYLREIERKKQYQLWEGERMVAHVAIDSSTGGEELIRKLSEDQFDIAFGGVPAMVSFIDRGSCIKIVAPANADGDGLVVRPDMPVKNWQEFVKYVREQQTPVRMGYKIEIAVQNLIFEAALREYGLRFSRDLLDKDADVVLINLFGAKNLIPALRDGLIDGFVVNQPFVAKAEYKGIGRLIAPLSDLPPDKQWQGHPCCALAICDKFENKFPAAAEAFVSLILRANRFIIDQPRIAIGLIADWLDVDRQIEELSVPTISYTVDFNDDWQRGVSLWVEEMVKAGRLQGRVGTAADSSDLDQLLYARDIYEKARKRL